MKNWKDETGDAHQELVFVGTDMDEAGLRRRLDAALLNDEERRAWPDGWKKMPDPFQPGSVNKPRRARPEAIFG